MPKVREGQIGTCMLALLNLCYSELFASQYIRGVKGLQKPTTILDVYGFVMLSNLRAHINNNHRPAGEFWKDLNRYKVSTEGHEYFRCRWMRINAYTRKQLNKYVYYTRGEQVVLIRPRERRRDV